MKMINSATAQFNEEKEIQAVIRFLEGSYDCQYDDQICEGKEEGDEDFESNNMDDIREAIETLNEVLNNKQAKYPINVYFCNCGGDFVDGAMDDVVDYGLEEAIQDEY